MATTSGCRCGRTAEYPKTAPERCALHQLQQLVEAKFGVAKARQAIDPLDTPEDLIRAALRAQSIEAYAEVLNLLARVGEGFSGQWYDVVLLDPGETKIAVIKVIRACAGIGLKDALDLTNVAPCRVVERISDSDALDVKRALEEAGARVRINPHDDGEAQRAGA